MRFLIFCISIVTISSNLFGQFQYCNSPTHVNLNDVYFIDQYVGIAVGDSGTIIRTVDGGVNWSLYNTPYSLKLTKVKFFDNLTGLAISSDGGMYRTTDAGLTWLFKSTGGAKLWSIEIMDANCCIISLYSSRVLRSCDKGNGFYTDGPNQYFRLMSFLDTHKGFSLTERWGNGINFTKTGNGGHSWTTVTVNTPLSGYTAVVEALEFISDSIGFQGGSYKAPLKKTTDGGITWKSVNYLDTNASNQMLDFHISINQPEAYYTCGKNAKIFKSVDGGDLWFQVNSGISNPISLNGIYFINDTIGWAVGDHGTIIKTTNGGGYIDVEEFENKLDFKIYPNPINDVIHIDVGNIKTINSIKILDLNGQIIKSVEVDEDIEIDFLESGFYFLQIETDKGIYEEKIIKE